MDLVDGVAEDDLICSFNGNISPLLNRTCFHIFPHALRHSSFTDHFFLLVYAYRVGCKYNIETARLLAFTSQVAHIWYILAKAQYNTCALVCTVIQALETETVEQSWDADSLLMIQAIFLKAKTQNKDRRIIPIHAPMIFLAISGCQFTIETTASFKMLAQLLNIGHCALSTIDSPAECKKRTSDSSIIDLMLGLLDGGKRH